MFLKHALGVVFFLAAIAMDVAHAVPQADSLRPRMLKDQWYRFKRTVPVTIYEDKQARSSNLNVAGLSQLRLAEGIEFNVMDVSEDGQLLQIGIDDDVIAEMNPSINPDDPVIAWVRADELHNVELVLLESEETISDLFQIGQTEQSEYLETDVAARKGGHVYRRGRRGGKRMTYCLRDVRLTAAQYTSARNIPRVGVAAHAYGAYRAKGWRPIQYSERVSAGTACFFGGGRRDCNGPCGHAAIKKGPNRWKGAGMRPTPFLKGRSLIGCLTPPRA